MGYMLVDSSVLQVEVGNNFAVEVGTDLEVVVLPKS